MRIEQTIRDIADEVTVVIVTHNMQQAQRVSDSCAFFLAEENSPGRIIESGPTARIFGAPTDQRTSDYVNGHFG
jgi:phosphate transport system ATP-binding protein